MNLDGSGVLLTGATGGIGQALTDALVAAGARVHAVGRDATRLGVLVARHGAAVVPIAADLSDESGRARVVEAAGRLRPSVLVLAHAQGAFGLFEEQPAERVRALLETNLVASALLVHALLPQLRAQPQAAVVAIGSTFGSLAYPGFAAYSASKFGLRGLIEGLAREHADAGLRFQYLSPRATRTAFNPPAVEALNRALKVAEDEPAAVAAQIVEAIRSGRSRLQLGWPEKLFAWLNGAWPALIDRNLKSRLPLVRQHARS